MTRWNRSRPPTAMIFRASALACTVSALTKFWMRWLGITRGSSSRVGPREKEEREGKALKRKKRKKFRVRCSLSLSSFFFFSLFLSLSFFLSFQKMRRRDFLVFLPPLLEEERAGSYRRIKENYNIFARTETSKRKRKEQKTSDVEREESSCVSSDRMPRARL